MSGVDGDRDHAVKVDGQLQRSFVFAVGVDRREDGHGSGLVAVGRRTGGLV